MTDREKLEKIKSLADKMYTSMQNLTSDTTPIRKAMDEYHQFLIYEYYKEEPTIPDIVDEHFDEMLGEEPVSEDLEEAIGEYCSNPENFITYIDVGFMQSPIKNDDIPLIIKAIKFGAKWKEQQMKANTVDVTVHIDNGNYPYIPQMELYDYDKDIPLAKEGDKYKVILIKE